MRLKKDFFCNQWNKNGSNEYVISNVVVIPINVVSPIDEIAG